MRQQINTGPEPLNRAGEVMRIDQGPSRVKRIGHAVMGTPKNQETVRWFRETLGLVGSDDVYAGSQDNIIGQFSRLDNGDEYVDHHAFFCMKNERVGLNHFSFEVQDIDDVFMGHEHLSRMGKYEHMWGIGRHLLGSQVYDYWADPWMRVHEHWADTDRLNLAQWREPGVGGGRPAFAVGHPPAGEVHRPRDPVTHNNPPPPLEGGGRGEGCPPARTVVRAPLPHPLPQGRGGVPSPSNTHGRG